MTKPAVFTADYYTFEYKKGLKVCRLVFEVPYENAKLVRDVLGDPPLPGEQVSVAIARLATPVAEPLPSAAQAASTPDKAREALTLEGEARGEYTKPRTPFRDMPRSQQAALKCRDGGFQEWIKRKYYTAWHEVPLCDEEPENSTNEILKAVCGIKSKKDLDAEGPSSRMWDQLRATFDNRDLIR